MAKGGRYLNTGAGKTKKGKGPKLFSAIVGVILIFALAAAAGGAIYYNSMLNLITRPETTEYSLSDEEFIEILGFVPETVGEEEETIAPAEEAETTAQPKIVEDHIVNIMLIGQHMQAGEDSKLSDTMILCSINKDTATVTLTSFQRDLYLKLPNYKKHVCGKNRMNVAYNLGWRWAGEQGGMEMLDQLILESFGVEVDYNVEIGFDGFVDAVDVMGGVELTLTDAEASRLMLGKGGDYHLNGEKALEYARLRKTDNDFYRTSRQRNVIAALINKARTMRLSELNDLLKQLLPLVITDMTNDEITSLLLEVVPLLADLKIDSRQIPMEGTYWYDMIDISGMPSSVVICEMEPNKQMLMEVAEPSDQG